MDPIIKELSLMGIVPVIKLDDAKNALPLAKALREGGINCAEITFRTSAAEQSIKDIIKAYPDMVVGAGTVLTTSQVDKAVAAGAKFIVAPGFNKKVVKHCLKIGIPMIPGCINPGDIEQALELGLTELKFFPAELAGGLPMIQALCAPYTTIRFMPTGGVNVNNMLDYLESDKIFACGGTWMVRSSLIDTGEFKKIAEMSAEAVGRMHGFKLTHIGINNVDTKSAVFEAKRLCDMFNFAFKDGHSSCFAGEAFEMVKGNGKGTHGHIAIACNNVDRALYMLKAKAYDFDESSAKYDSNKKLKSIYFKEEFCGFAIHLINK